MKVRETPIWTSDLPGVGGEFKQSPDDFEVDEVELYAPSGQGHHIYLRVQKRGVDSGQMLKIVSRRLGVRRRDIGLAGHKDKQALTTQWVSVPGDSLSAEQVDALPGDWSERMKVIEVKRHRNKLRRGHLAGNRFRLRIRDLSVGVMVAQARAEAIADVLGRTGFPNFYGGQRFGDRGKTLAIGLGLLREEEWASREVRGRRFLRRLAVNAVQSHLFNCLLARRLERGYADRVLPGDVLQKTDTGGIFVVEPDEIEAGQRRLEAGEVVITGPMPGPKMVRAGLAAGALEEEVFAEEGVDVERFSALRRLAPGTRRALLAPVRGLSVVGEGAGDSLEVHVELDAGCYATVLLREFMVPSES